MATGSGFRRAAAGAVAKVGAAVIGHVLASKRPSDSQHPETPRGKKDSAAAAAQGPTTPLVVQSFTTPGGPAGPSQAPQPQVAEPFDFKLRCGRCGLRNC